jgi:hypothetical protein
MQLAPIQAASVWDLCDPHHGANVPPGLLLSPLNASGLAAAKSGRETVCDELAMAELDQVSGGSVKPIPGGWICRNSPAKPL